jgi:hypothetical protein
MKKTLLELVQNILSDISGDEVNSYADTTESEQVARIIRETWEHIVTKADLPETYGLFELEASGDPAKPTLMTLQSSVDSIEWLKYNCIASGEVYPNFKALQYLPLLDFIERMYNGLPAASDTTVGTFEHTVNTSSLSFYYWNDKAPQYFTTTDDTTFIFDSYDSVVDTTLQKTKTLGYGKLLPTFTMADNFVPALDANQFPLLLQEAKAQAYNELRQMDNVRADKRAREHWIKSQEDKSNIGRNIPYWQKSYMPYNYGRKTR